MPTHDPDPTAGPTRRVEHLWSLPNPAGRAAATGQRLLGLASQLGHDETITIKLAPTHPSGALTISAPASLTDSDLAWAFEPVGALGTPPPPLPCPPPARIWQVHPALEPDPAGQGRAGLPTAYLDALGDLVPALIETAAAVRIHLAAATALETRMLADLLTDRLPPELLHAYLGTPIRARMLLGLPSGAPTARLRLLLTALGTGTSLQELTARPHDRASEPAWHGQPDTLAGHALPEATARILTRVPAADLGPRAMGIPTMAPPPPPVPVSAPLPDEGIVLGEALDATGARVLVRARAEDLLRHVQVIGASGTGKTSFLTGLVVSAAEQGLGATVLSPHPDLADRLARELPRSAATRTRLVRSGDPDAVVRLNPVAGGSETALETLMEVFQELLDPARTGMFGMRAQRLVTLAVKALILLAGDRASLPAATLVYQDQRFVRALAAAINPADPDLAADLVTEVAGASPTEYSELIGWFRSRFHKLIGTAAMTGILGSGADAVDITDTLNNHGLLLVDLASTQLGTSSAQLLGEIWLTKHWDALARRHEPRAPHLLVVDEAHLFGAGLLPRIIAEGRKFGIAVILAHQHLGQLHPALREAAQANASTLLAFRVGPTEAAAVAARLGTWPGPDLTRLANLTAATTLSTQAAQTAPFTLTVTHNATTRTDQQQAATIAAHSRTLLVEPHQGARPLTPADLHHLVDAGLAAPPPQPTPRQLDLEENGLLPRRFARPLQAGLPSHPTAQ